MKIALIVLLVVLGLLVIGGIGSYNNLVDLDEGANSAWGQVENVYQRRFDLIPNMLESVKGYLSFEKETFTAVTEARQQVTNLNVSSEEIAKNPMLQKQFLEAQQNLNSTLSKLMVVVEKYPELKGIRAVTAFMDEQAGSENRIAVERKRFQEAVNEYNRKVRKFPSNIIASIGGFEKREYYAAEEGAQRAPKVKF